MIAEKQETRLILDDIRSVHNVGSIFRTAECAGISHIYCCGTTPAPFDRFGRKRKDFAKVALGAEDLVGWESVEGGKIAALIRRLKKEGFMIVAVEQARRSVDYRELGKREKAASKTAFILGNEVGGVSPEILKLADVIVEIPLYGEKESLNVSVAAGIILFAR